LYKIDHCSSMCRAASIDVDVTAIARSRAPTVFFGTDEKHIRTEEHGYG